MDFFEHQAQAKAASTRLLLLFLSVCVVFVMAVNGVIYMLLGSITSGHLNVYSVAELSFSGFLSWQISLHGLYASLLSVFMISIGCFARWFELRKGGNGLAIGLGARSLGFASDVEKEQQLINVVEEMAIASGVTTPGVYVLDNESAVNAFVVGYGFEDSALVVTRGLLNTMNRDELQAVVGHEFSHILHGDNRLNIRLLVLLAGFVWVAELGRMLLLEPRHRSGYGYRRSRSYSSGDRRGGGLIIGVPLIVIGYLGVFFGRLVRTSISRKREYLADASSVQFTRNPEALASALNVILLNGQQGLLKSPRAEEISHMCIASSRKNNWFATHPPLLDRINAIDKTFLKRDLARKRKATREKQAIEQQQQVTQNAKTIYGADVSRLQNEANDHLHNVIGTLAAVNLEYAMSLHDDMPYEFRQALQHPEKARIILLYILLNEEQAIRTQQLEWIKQQHPNCDAYINDLNLLSSQLHERLAIPLVELLVPLLKTLDAEIQKGLLEQVLVLAKWDKQLSLFEICVYTLLKNAFSETLNRSSHTIKNINVVAHEFNVVISSLIHNTGANDVEKITLHKRMLNVFTMAQSPLIAESSLQAKELYLTLKKLKALAPMLKRSLMDVCGDIVLHDGIVEPKEYQALKLISIILSCPMPALPLATST